MNKCIMESEEKENIEQNLDELTADLSRRSLKKIERANNEQKGIVSLILDKNELQRLDNLDTYTNVKRLSLSSNRLIRMEGVSCMVNLTVLDISNNSLVCIEGLKDLKNLKHLNLSGNKIKTIDHINYNLSLEFLDLSQNIIGHISDISFLQDLKELFLHNNEIAHLRQCEKNLPVGLETLTLNNNCITDLNEISHLVLLRSLKELSLSNNPCLEFTDSRIDFNYRPFVKNWCTSVIKLDGYALDDIECLKAEWLYSQGRGRSFRPGEHIALAKYLTSVCPRTTEPNVESEDEKKLRMILSKAQHHQQQLKEELTGSPVSGNRYKLALNRRKSSVASDRMVSSYHDSTPKETTRGVRELMSRSLDGVLIRNSPGSHNDLPESYHSPLQTATTLLPVPESLTSPDVCRSVQQFPSSNANTKITFPLATSYPNRNPTPSSKNSQYSSPDIKSPGVLRRQNNNSSPLSTRKCGGILSPSKNKSSPVKPTASPKKKVTSVSTGLMRRVQTNGKESSEECDSEYSFPKVQKLSNQKMRKNYILNVDEKENLDSVRQTSENDMKESDIWKAALCIQRYWRGYQTRNLNKSVIEAYKNIQTTRIQDYIIKVANDMEAAKVTLEGHRKLQVLQMRAINALWKKIVSLQPGDVIASSSDNKNTLQGLAETCINLNKQVEELQNMMKVMHQANQCQSVPTATQTEIVAVHTPQGEDKNKFLYPRLERPSILEINEQLSEPEQFSSNLISDVKAVTPALDSSSETNGCGTELSSNSEGKDKEDSVCLTPACQEGKDLQSVVNSKTEFAVRTITTSNVNTDNNETEDLSLASEQANSGTIPDLRKLSVDRDEYQQNGCPSS